MSTNRGQRGAVLLELVVAVGIMAMVASLASSAVFQMFKTSEKGTDRVIALHDLENAIHWIDLDTGKANASDLVDGAPPVEAMTLTWTEGSTLHTVTYTFSGTELRRDHNGQVTAVARHLSNIEFSMLNSVITATITSSPDGRWGVSKEMACKAWLQPME
jgi:type II secretory pathway pseudopilin PulG